MSKCLTPGKDGEKNWHTSLVIYQDWGGNKIDTSLFLLILMIRED